MLYVAPSNALRTVVTMRAERTNMFRPTYFARVRTMRAERVQFLFLSTWVSLYYLFL